MEGVRLIILNHGEDIRTAYMRILEQHIEEEINTIKEHLKKSHAEDIKALSGTEDDPLSSNFYAEKKEALLKKLNTYFIPINEKYMNPHLSKKGHIQTCYSGRMLKLYLKQNNLKSARLGFSAPSNSTFNGSLNEVLNSYDGEDNKPKIVIIPYFVENRRQYKRENFESHEVLDGEFNPMDITSKDSNEKVANRFKKGLEKVFLKNKEALEEGVPILMIHGSVLDKFFKICLNEEIGPINDSAAYDITILFNENGNFESVKLNAEIQMDANLSKECNTKIEESTPFTPDKNNKEEKDDFDDALTYICEETPKWEIEIAKWLTSNNKTNIEQLPEAKLLTRKKFVRKVSFKKDIEDFLKDTKAIDVLGIYDLFRRQKNRCSSGDTNIETQESLVTASSDNDDLSTLAVSLISSSSSISSIKKKTSKKEKAKPIKKGI